MTPSCVIRLSGVAAVLWFSGARPPVLAGAASESIIPVQKASTSRDSAPAKGGGRPSKAPAAKCNSCQEQRPTLDPGLFGRGYEANVRPAYEMARKYPSTLDRIHCFCECRESPVFKHKTLLSCFADTHAAGCGICLEEATLAGRLKDSGLSDEQVVRKVEGIFRTEGHPGR